MTNNSVNQADPLDKKILAGLAELLPGSEIIDFQRQARWRPAWDIVIRIDGVDKKINVRAEKGQNYVGPLSLEEEANVHHVLERHGIPVPHVYGMLKDPIAIVMDFLPGQINLATAQSNAARQNIRQQYIEALVKMHCIPVEEFAEIGLNIPAGPEQIALNLYAPCEKIYRQKMVDRPFSLMEFIWQWVQRNTPSHRNSLAFITADSGQFLFDKDQLTGLIDFEVGYVGDPLAEFAGMRLRDSTEPLGDIGELMDHYEALTGDKLDKHSVEYHTAGFCAINGFLLWPLAFEPASDDDYVAYLSFSVGTSRWAISAIAEALDLKLEDPAEPEASPLTFLAAGEHLSQATATLRAQQSSLDYELGKVESLSRYMDRYNRFGRSMMEANLEDASRLVGKQLTTPEEAELALIEFIEQNEQQKDRLLVSYFHRWLKRMDFVLSGCGSSAYLTGIDLQRISERSS